MKEFEFVNWYHCVVSGCRYVSKTEKNLKQHLNYHYAKILTCDVEGCNFSTKTTETLKHHERCHTGEKPEVCLVCGKKFRKRHHMLLHVQSIHPETVPENYGVKCHLCNYRAAVPYQLKTHMFIHQDQKLESDHYCESCDRYFSCLSVLVKHQTTKKHRLKAGQPPTWGKNKDKRWEQVMDANLGEVKESVVTVTTGEILKSTLINENAQSSESQLQLLASDELDQVPSCQTLPIPRSTLIQLAETIPRRYSKQQRRLRKGKPPKKNRLAFRCTLCTYQTDDVWLFFRHLRKLFVSSD